MAALTAQFFPFSFHFIPPPDLFFSSFSTLWASWRDWAVRFNEAGAEQTSSSGVVAQACPQHWGLAFRSHSFSSLCICIFLHSFNTSWRMHCEHRDCESLRLPVLTAPWLKNLAWAGFSQQSALFAVDDSKGGDPVCNVYNEQTWQQHLSTTTASAGAATHVRA